jgi:hypothetical protein
MMPAPGARSIRAGGSRPSANHRGIIDVTSTESPSNTNLPNGQVALNEPVPTTPPVRTTRSDRTGIGGATTNPDRSDRPAPSWNTRPPGPDDPSSSADGAPPAPGGTQGSSFGRDALEVCRRVNPSSSPKSWVRTVLRPRLPPNAGQDTLAWPGVRWSPGRVGFQRGQSLVPDSGCSTHARLAPHQRSFS